MAEKLKEKCEYRRQLLSNPNHIFSQFNFPTLPVPATASVISHASPFDFDIDTHLLLSAVRML